MAYQATWIYKYYLGQGFFKKNKSTQRVQTQASTPKFVQTSLTFHHWTLSFVIMGSNPSNDHIWDAQKTFLNMELAVAKVTSKSNCLAPFNRNSVKL